MIHRSAPGSLKRVGAPDASPITLTQAKSHLRVDAADDDTLIKAYIAAATEFVDGPRGYLGRALMEQTWDYFLDRFPGYGTAWHFHGYWCNVQGESYIELPLPPLISVTGVFYRDASGAEQTLSPSTYRVSSSNEPGKIYVPSGGSWPTLQSAPDTVRIRFKAGYGDEDLPAAIKAAILIHIGDLYENRDSQVIGDSATALPWTAEQLLRPHRFYLGMA